MMSAVRSLALLLGVLALSTATACQPDLGACDETLARRPVWDEFGSPAYEGQAMMIASCGFGAFCHSENISDEDRYGVPRGLEWDLRLAAQDSTYDPEEVARLSRMLRRAYDDRYLLWNAVHDGRMPIGGPIGHRIAASAPTYYRQLPDGSRTPIPSLDSAEGRESYRNWLACGLPVVERTEPVVLTPGYVAVGSVVSAIETTPLTASWHDIYTNLVAPRCATLACHGDARAGGLSLVGEEESRTYMLGAVAQGTDCVGSGTRLLVAGDSGASLFVQKLVGQRPDGQPVCGRTMPIGGSKVSAESLDAIEQWVDAGALAN